jgi:hypothetical protein
VCDEPDIRAFLARLREAYRRNNVQVDTDTQQEAEGLGFGPTDIENVLTNLRVVDFKKRVPSTRYPGHLVWVFTPYIDEELTLWIRMVEMRAIIVFSFHGCDWDEDSP